MFPAVRILARIAYLALTLWLGGSAILFGLMLLPPAQFAGWIAKAPPVIAMKLLPFRTLWSWARRGDLGPGDPAPDFDLPRQDRTGRVQLSSHLGSRPVVLVFGSYT